MYSASRDKPSPATPQDRFLDQFEWGGGDFIYRYDQTGQAYRVTADERYDFIETFERRWRWYTWLGAIFLAICIGVFVWVEPHPATSSAEILFSIVLLGGAWAIGWGMEKLSRHYILEAPQRALAHRVPVAPALSKVERQRVLFDRVSGREWIGLSGVVGIYALLFLANESLDGGKHAFPWLCVFLIWAWRWAELTIQLIRKYLLARADHVANNLI